MNFSDSSNNSVYPNVPSSEIGLNSVPNPNQIDSPFSNWSKKYKYLYPTKESGLNTSNNENSRDTINNVSLNNNIRETLTPNKSNVSISFLSPEESPFYQKDTLDNTLIHGNNSSLPRRRRHVRSSDISVINQSAFQRQNTAQRLTRNFLDKIFRWLEQTWFFKWLSKSKSRTRKYRRRTRNARNSGPQTFGNRYYHGSSRIASSRHESFISSIVDKYIQIRQISRGNTDSLNQLNSNHQFSNFNSLGYGHNRSRISNQSDSEIARDVVDRMDRYLGWSKSRPNRSLQSTPSSSPLLRRTPFTKSFYYLFIIVPILKILYIFGYMVLYMIIKPIRSLFSFLIRIASSFQS
mmetsp:Transcript_13704/g.20761  ORF Transcript_13704/g.20761 Transcript_13704/m.20761 type:complete len:350 (+) Transcript_13704:34-1083(+)